jgi:hypothetical protein
MGRKSFELCWLEDELWNLMRIAPDRLPTGKQKVLPGSLYTWLSHQPLEIQDAVLTLKEDGEKMGYKIEYAAQQHSITIQFEKAFPHRILGWEETFPGFDGKLLTTTATLDKTVISDYWVHHTNADRVMREELDLPLNY